MDNNIVERLKELVPYKILAPTPNEIIIYIEQLQSNWNSLREWLEKQNKFYEVSTMGYSYGVICNVLDKMNELEGKNKE